MKGLKPNKMWVSILIWEMSIWIHGLNPFNPEITIVIFIHYKPRIAIAILDL